MLIEVILGHSIEKTGHRSLICCVADSISSVPVTDHNVRHISCMQTPIDSEAIVSCERNVQ